MQKYRTYFFIAAFISLSQQTAVAEQQYESITPQTIEQAAEQNTPATAKDFDPSLEQSEDEDNATEITMDDGSSTTKGILSEIVIRPFAVLGSITGFALFVVASPFSGLASIPEPHDAFKTTWDNFVVTPYYFAFRRPLGDYSVELNP
ncbi:hypothetical protein [Methyloprofundus sp.]|uniref:hypothetical protein n=1 Tax=Methyloprofundus sp. TaxID=2020875 RepID=UPI003D12A9A0